MVSSMGFLFLFLFPSFFSYYIIIHRLESEFNFGSEFGLYRTLFNQHIPISFSFHKEFNSNPSLSLNGLAFTRNVIL